MIGSPAATLYDTKIPLTKVQQASKRHMVHL